MSSIIQKYLPPALVLGAAAFFGWPPSQPLDLGDDVVRATSVRWRSEDLAAPPRIELSSDPFEEVLVVADVTDEADSVAEQVPPGPTAEELKDGLRLDGFAGIAGRRWALVNGRPRLPGDEIRTNDTREHSCRLEAIESDHIVVRCEGTVAEIHLRAFGSQRSQPVNAASSTPVSATPVSRAPQATEEEILEVPPPPQA